MQGVQSILSNEWQNIGLQNIMKTFIPNFVAFFVFSGTASSCIFKISNSETLAKREFTPSILFLFGLRIIHSAGGE